MRLKLYRSLLLIFAIAGLLPPVMLRFIAWYNGRALDSWPVFFGYLLSSVITTVTISCGVVTVMIWLQKKYPWQQGILKRIFLEIVLTTLTACVLITILTILTNPFYPGRELKTVIPAYIVIAVILNAVLVSITEGVFFFRNWKASAVESERFKKESIQAQFESLKNQVNPHFLFNSLNTLSGMIDVDKEMSKVFIDHLSQVYRYVLQHKDAALVTLETELDFIRAFTQLLKKRHGDRIMFHFNIAHEDLGKSLPPMTLQLLVENAVKHNIASRKSPLKIELFSRRQKVVVRNNLQRQKVVTSTGVGLENIRNRYRFLIEKEIEILEGENTFEVSVPLITHKQIIENENAGH